MSRSKERASSMKRGQNGRTSLALAVMSLAALTAAPAHAQTDGYWKFDEGGFLPGCPSNPLYNNQGHIQDWSGNNNDGCVENPSRNIKFTTDAYPAPAPGNAALWLNDPADAATKIYDGYSFVAHNTTLEPPTGMITARVKLDAFPTADGLVLDKSTFWFRRTEPAIPTFDDGNGHQILVGRTVYELRILADGRLRATIGNDDPTTPGAPWRAVESGAALTVGRWNEIGMTWDGCNLTVLQNGASVAVPYDPVPLYGLSYQGTGDDPTYGPLMLNLGIGSGLVGKLDEVALSRIRPCSQFSAASTRQLISNVQALNLPVGPALVSMLNTVVARLGPDPSPYGPDPSPYGPDVSPFHVLRAFTNAVGALRGKKIAPAAADALIGTAQNIAAGLTIR